MSRLIADLSKNFEFDLFNKRDGQLTPSHEIQLLYPDIERVLELMVNIQNTSAEIKDRKAGTSQNCMPARVCYKSSS